MEEEKEKYIAESRLIDIIFDHPLEKRFLAWYYRFFSIREIEESKVLQWSFGAMLLVFLLAFSAWVRSGAVTIEAFATGTQRCWPYFQSCGEWYFLQALPDGYSQTILYMAFFGIMALIVFLMSKREWVLSHMLMTVLFVWEFILIFVLSGGISGNYDYYHIALTFVLLFIPFKLFFLQLILVLFYFLAATIKIHDGWILGTYFTSLKTGLPVFLDTLTPLITNLVIFMQIVGAWFLMSNNKLYQRLALFYFVVFHLYSGILVEYRYPATVLPILLILFGPWYENLKVPLNKKSIAGWVFVALLFFLQSLPFIISGDQKITLEGNTYGLYMFEANHQCISNVVVYGKDGTVSSGTDESESARSRCNPYNRWFRLKQVCLRNPEVSEISWTFDHSVNGGPFYRIVDEENVCNLEYHAFRHNEWIKTPVEGAPAVGRPVENVYY
jgi:hypothetical protein